MAIGFTTLTHALLINPNVVIKRHDGAEPSPKKIFSVKTLKCLETRIASDYLVQHGEFRDGLLIKRILNFF